MKNQGKNHKTRYPEAEAVLTFNRSGNKVTGYMVSAETGELIPGMERVIRTSICHNKAERNLAGQKVISRLEEEYAKKVLKKSPGSDGTEKKGMFAAAYAALGEDVEEALNENGWAPSTVHKYCTFFSRNIIPELDSVPAGELSFHLPAIRERILKKSLEGSRSGDSAEGTAENWFQAANELLKALRKYSPELPNVAFEVKSGLRRAQIEQVKALPNICRVKLMQFIFRDLESDAQDAAGVKTCELAMAMAVMLLGGTRTGESIGPRFGDFTVYPEQGFVTLFIDKHLANYGEISRRLKRPSAYRLIVFPYAFLVILEKRRQKLLTEFTPQQVDEMPILDLKGGSPHKFSGYVRDRIIEAGFKAERLAELRQQMKMAPDIVDGVPEKDPVAYLLRHDWATRVLNLCGFSSTETDYRIGHANKDVNGETFKDPDVCARTARLLERYVFLPELSLNPLYLPLEIDDAIVSDLEPSAGYTIVNSGKTTLEVTLNVNGLEPGGGIGVGAPRRPKKWEQTGKTDSPEKRGQRPILGEVYDKTYYSER